MYGAVLWSDQCTNRALIWCEDHGNLAFFDGEPNEAADALEEGDLVTFKVRDGRGMRLASEVEIVAAEEYPYLAEDLRGVSTDDATASTVLRQTPERKILPFRQGASGAAPQDSPASHAPSENVLLLQVR